MPARNETLVEAGRECYTTGISSNSSDGKVLASMKSTTLILVLILALAVPAAAADSAPAGSKDAFVLAGDTVIPHTGSIAMTCSFPVVEQCRRQTSAAHFNRHVKLLGDVSPDRSICSSTDRGGGTIALKRNTPLR